MVSILRRRSLDYHLEQKEALTAILLTYPNVEIYDFQARTEWILDLNHYIDASTTGADINAAMAEDIAAGNLPHHGRQSGCAE